MDTKMLLMINASYPNVDSKDLVDMPRRGSLEEVTERFNSMMRKIGIIEGFDEHKGLADWSSNPRKDVVDGNVVVHYNREFISQSVKRFMGTSDYKSFLVTMVRGFVKSYFLPVGSDIEPHIPEDYSIEPRVLSSVRSRVLKDMILALNMKFKQLSRKKVTRSGITSTLIDLPHPFVMPGGRFRECYYWDAYWMAKGLLVVGMKKTAENITRNFMYMIDKFGYVPNGARTYYLNRTQPPYFPMMLWKLYSDGSEEHRRLVLNEGLKMADIEHEYFEKYRSVGITSNGKSYRLNYYHVDVPVPRPESLKEDIEVCVKNGEKNCDVIYKGLNSAAESGWDFSSRWLSDQKDLETISSYEQIPVDLNAVLYRGEKILEMLWKEKGNPEKEKMYRDASEERMRAINEVLWNDEEGTWMDYNMKNKKHVIRRFYASNIMPLMYGVRVPDGKSPYHILGKYSKEIFGYVGGIPASGESDVVSGQQWDFPNVWAPHQDMMVEYLVGIGEREMAMHVAKAFFNSVRKGYEDTGEFYEKYNCVSPGISGEGGEYEPQKGFGWTNGTILNFVKLFGDKLLEKWDHESSYERIREYLSEKLKNISAMDSYERVELKGRRPDRLDGVISVISMFINRTIKNIPVHGIAIPVN